MKKIKKMSRQEIIRELAKHPCRCGRFHNSKSNLFLSDYANYANATSTLCAEFTYHSVRNHEQKPEKKILCACGRFHKSNLFISDYNKEIEEENDVNYPTE